MESQDLYILYLKNCIDKKETPLSYKEWVLNYGKQEIEFNKQNK